MKRILFILCTFLVQQNLCMDPEWDILARYHRGELLYNILCATPETSIPENKNAITISEEYKEIVKKAQECQSSPLEVACVNGRTKIVEYLLTETTTNINARDIEGNTPLHATCNEGYLDCISLLLKCPNTKINARNKEKVTPLLLAYAHLNTQAIDLLLSRKDIDLWKPLPKDIATEQGLGNDGTIILLALADYKRAIDRDVLNVALTTSFPLMHIFQRFSIEQKDLDHCKVEDCKIENIFYSFLRFVVLHQQYSHNSVERLFSDFKKTYETLLLNRSKQTNPFRDRIRASFEEESSFQDKKFFKEKSSVQEKALHHTIRKNLHKMPCALFFEICAMIAPTDIKNITARLLIAHYYYELNRETIAAQLYRNDPYYFMLPEEERILIKEQLYKNPKSFYLLWHNGKKKHLSKKSTTKK